MNQPILPGSTIGIIGGGQLGFMMAQSAQQMGYYVSVLDPDPDSPACQVTHKRMIGRYDDQRHINLLRQSCAVITYEFENVNPEPLQAIRDEGYPLHPNPKALYIGRHRSREKDFAASCGFQTTQYTGNLTLDLNSDEHLQKLISTIQKIGDCIIKTEEGGYDGKGQLRISNLEPSIIRQSLIDFHKSISTDNKPISVIVEQRIKFNLEFSLIGSRFSDGSVRMFAPFENQHRNGILHTTICPADIPLAQLEKCQAAMRRMLTELNYLGVLAIEFFLSEDGQVLFNEMAPRPHNSGHLTIEAYSTSQFELHIRSICGLPSVEPQFRQFAAMLNLVSPYKPISEIANQLLSEPECHLHLYGKKGETIGRKMGHVTVLSNTKSDLLNKLNRIERLIYG